MTTRGPYQRSLASNVTRESRHAWLLRFFFRQPKGVKFTQFDPQLCEQYQAHTGHAPGSTMLLRDLNELVETGQLGTVEPAGRRARQFFLSPRKVTSD